MADLERRDPNNLNDHARCEFEDVLGEPDGVKSMDCVWKLAYTCFNCTRQNCYKLMTLFCGICMAFGWGWIYACVVLQHVWCITPSFRCCEIYCVPCRKIYALCIDCYLGPLCESLGLCFSRIKIQKA